MPIAIATIFAAIVKYWREAIIAGLFLLACFLDLRVQHWHRLADERAATIAQVQTAQKKATAAAQAAHKAQEARYKELADAADTNHATQTASADDAVRAYIASHRVRPNAACPASSAAQGASSSDSKGAVRSDPAPDMVAVSPEDIHVCTDNTLRLEAARDWASELNQ